MLSRSKVVILVLGVALALVAGFPLIAPTAQKTLSTVASAVWGS